MSLCLQTTKGDVNLASAYAPTLGASPDDKDSFYEAIADTVRIMDIDEPFSSSLWISTHVPKISGFVCFYPYAIMGEFCTVNDVAIANTFFGF